MFTVRIADLNVKIHNRYGFIEELCRDYMTEDGAADIEIDLTDEELEREALYSAEEFGREYLEATAVYRKICEEIPLFGAIYMHASVVALDGEAYAFAARSGVGKSTHSALWLRHFGERAFVVNGDKPLLRFSGGKLLVYGTPWCGKEGMHTNTAVPLKAICFIERGKVNGIRRADADEALGRIFKQILVPREERRLSAFMEVLDRVMSEIPMYVLTCNISDEAAVTAYNGMK